MSETIDDFPENDPYHIEQVKLYRESSKLQDEDIKNVFDKVRNGENKNDFFIRQRPQFAILTPDKKRGPRSNIMTEDLKEMGRDKRHQEEDFCHFGDTTGSIGENTDGNPSTPPTPKASRRRRVDRLVNNNVPPGDYVINNNNNNNNNSHVKNERLSPGTPDTSSRSRSVTPSSVSHPDTPPAPETNPMVPISSRNYSDFMRSLAAKYNNNNPNDYFGPSRNGFPPPPPLDPRFKPQNMFPSLLTNMTTNSKEEMGKKPDFSSILNPFAATSMFPPLFDMSATQTLLTMVRTAKEAELQGLLKNVKRQDVSSPLDLSAAAPPLKRPRMKTSPSTAGRAESESPRLQAEDVTTWTVDDVCNFVAGIDICAEYAQNFREHRIDGSGLPLLTEEHLTTTMGMKLGPALKLRSILAKKINSCSMCLHCVHCHSLTGSPKPANTTGNTSDSGGAS